MSFCNKRITFDNFLSGIPARDYIFQKAPYEDQIYQAAKMIQEADYILIGIGAGMSIAAGAIYGGDWFKENFADFCAKYGNGSYMQDMYSAGFYPYPSEEAYWGYWSKQCMKAGIEANHTMLYKTLLSMLDSKEIFCLSTNVDGQLEKAGLTADKIFCTQGDYFHIQCAKGCHQNRYDARELFRQMDAARVDYLIPSTMVPKCPVCGGRMNMNLRIDQYFVQDAEWYIAEKHFEDFLSEAISTGMKICLLELGVGFNTPTIIRFPFEKLTRENKQISLLRVNLNEAVVPEHLGARAIGINVDIKQSIEDICRAMK